ncbi:hypothetical protein PSTG_12552 [Puccinia striiformis f. sp. tritici PST-78]|uniref:DUF4939 domain-containing protein n=1 Tax=Puccinia striiformis f. sp. tritici PST-78 TaxID=1165861 RepID=A0A0L0V4A0_9BASI|nr:hypothetical protein PSTG_12552 [Puccinia striiformis f. sp. tritici PST-78]
MKLALPNKFDGTRGNKAEAFTNQAGLYMSANAAKFTTDQIKVIFCVLNLTGSAITWAQTYLNMLLNNEEQKAKAKKTLRQLKQTKLVAAYTHQIATHSTNLGWEVLMLISQYVQGSKKDIRMGIIYTQASFTTLEEATHFALKIDKEMNGTNTTPTQTTL